MKGTRSVSPASRRKASTADRIRPGAGLATARFESDSFRVHRAIAVLSLLPMVLVACARPSASGASEQMMPVGPVIARLVPDHGPAGEAYPIRVVIEGRRFAPANNTVRFGPVTLSNVPSDSGGTRIVFFAPKTVPSQGEVPPRPLMPDGYDVTVTTAEGTSAPARFLLQPSGP